MMNALRGKIFEVDSLDPDFDKKRISFSGASERTISKFESAMITSKTPLYPLNGEEWKLFAATISDIDCPSVSINKKDYDDVLKDDYWGERPTPTFSIPKCELKLDITFKKLMEINSNLAATVEKWGYSGYVARNVKIKPIEVLDDEIFGVPPDMTESDWIYWNTSKRNYTTTSQFKNARNIWCAPADDWYENDVRKLAIVEDTLTPVNTPGFSQPTSHDFTLLYTQGREVPPAATPPFIEEIQEDIDISSEDDF